MELDVIEKQPKFYKQIKEALNKGFLSHSYLIESVNLRDEQVNKYIHFFVKTIYDNYYDDNNYHLALMEYENCVILNERMLDKVGDRIDRLKSFINPEARIIKTCLEKGSEFYADGNYKTSDKYFSKVMLMANENSAEYKLAKSRVMNV